MEHIIGFLKNQKKWITHANSMYAYDHNPLQIVTDNHQSSNHKFQHQQPRSTSALSVSLLVICGSVRLDLDNQEIICT